MKLEIWLGILFFLVFGLGVFDSTAKVVKVSKEKRFERVNHGRIVGGWTTKPGEVPYIVSLLWFGEHFCGGSILTPNVIMTAGHCLYGYEDDPYDLVAGEWSLTGDDGTEQRRTVSRLLIHPGYNDRTYVNDVALLWVNEPLVFNEFVQPIPLPAQMHHANGSAPVYGWGVEEEDGPELSDKLKGVTLDIINDADCRRLIGGNPNQIADSMVCAYHAPGGHDSCQGDSGGPLTNNNTGTVYVAGIVSWGYGCARPGVPGVYTEVSYFTDWIRNQIALYA